MSAIVQADAASMSASRLMIVESKEFTVPRTVDDGKIPKGSEEDTVVKIEPVPLMLVRPEMINGSDQVKLQLSMCNDSD